MFFLNYKISLRKNPQWPHFFSSMSLGHHQSFSKKETKLKNSYFSWSEAFRDIISTSIDRSSNDPNKTHPWTIGNAQLWISTYIIWIRHIVYPWYSKSDDLTWGEISCSIRIDLSYDLIVSS